MALLNQMRVGRGGVDAHRLGTVVLVNLAPLDGFEIVAGLLTQNFGTSDCFGFQLIAFFPQKGLLLFPKLIGVLPHLPGEVLQLGYIKNF